MLTTATPAGADARLEQIARLNDRTRLGLDRSARVVITRNCLERLAEAEGAPEDHRAASPPDGGLSALHLLGRQP
jgi:hypothetical protein